MCKRVILPIAATVLGFIVLGSLFFWLLKPSGRNVKEIESVLYLDSTINQDVIKKVNLSDFIVKPKFEKIVKLQTSDSCLISSICKIESDSNYLFIHSQRGRNSELLIFDKNGQFYRRISKQGQGPQEYVSLSSFFINKNNKTVNIVDGFTSRVLIFDYENNFISKINNNAIFDSGSMSECVYFNKKLFCYNLINPMLNVAMRSIDLLSGSFVDYFSHDPLQTEGYSDGINSSMSVNNNIMSFTKYLNDTIFTIDDNGVMSSSIVINHGKKLIDKTTIKEPFTFENSYRWFVYDHSREYFKGYEKIFQTDDYYYLISLSDSRMLSRYIVDKKKNIASYDLISYDDDINTFPLYIPSFVLDNCFVTIKQCDELLDDKLRFVNYPSIQEVISESKEDDNPCLIFYTL